MHFDVLEYCRRRLGDKTFLLSSQENLDTTKRQSSLQIRDDSKGPGVCHFWNENCNENYCVSRGYCASS
jgi:hypothetical protein